LETLLSGGEASVQDLVKLWQGVTTFCVPQIFSELPYLSKENLV
jgi:hypothetical protein